MYFQELKKRKIVLTNWICNEAWYVQVKLYISIENVSLTRFSSTIWMEENLSLLVRWGHFTILVCVRWSLSSVVKCLLTSSTIVLRITFGKLFLISWSSEQKREVSLLPAVWVHVLNLSLVVSGGPLGTPVLAARDCSLRTYTAVTQGLPKHVHWQQKQP